MLNVFLQIGRKIIVAVIPCRTRKKVLCMLTLQSSRSRSVCLLMFEVKRDSLGDVILLTSQGFSFTEVQDGLNVSTLYIFCPR